MPFIKKIGETIKKIHDLRDFKLTYHFSHTIHCSFQKNITEINQKLYPYYFAIKPIIQKIEGDLVNIVSSHNDLLPSNICYENKNIYFIDWEYSGKNHRSYDLSFLSISASFSDTQEKALLAGYDPKNKLDIQYYTTLMKSVVSFLLFQWGITKKTDEKSSILEKKLNTAIQAAYTTQTFRQHAFYTKASFFKLSAIQGAKSEKKEIENDLTSNNTLAKL